MFKLMYSLLLAALLLISCDSEPHTLKENEVVKKRVAFVIDCAADSIDSLSIKSIVQLIKDIQKEPCHVVKANYSCKDISCLFNKSSKPNGNVVSANFQMVYDSISNKNRLIYRIDNHSSGANIFFINDTLIFGVQNEVALFFDLEHHLYLAFRFIQGSFYKADTKSLLAIYILDDELMPNAAIKKLDIASDSLIIEKYNYDFKSKDLKGNQILINDLDKVSFSKIVYQDLLKINNGLLTGKFKRKNKIIFSNGGEFNKRPLWEDEVGAYSYGDE